MRVQPLVRTVILLAAIAFCSMPPAHAAPRHLPPGMPLITDYQGDGNHLPVGCNRSESQLLSHARAMSAVQAAIQVFQRRGYIAVTGADTAYNVCDDATPGSVVMLAYRHPTAWIDSNHVVAPAILISTTLNTVSGEPLTSVSGGTFVADGQSGQIFSADSLPSLRASDGSFDMVPRLGRDGGGPRARIGAEGLGDDLWRELRNPESSFNKYIRCVGISGMVCLVTAVRIGGPLGIPSKIAALMAQPELALALIYSCLTIGAIECLRELWH
jgi:hypothetical protein